MIEHPKWSDEILREWDNRAAKMEFPILGTNWHWIIGRARLISFRTDYEWITVFQVFRYYNGLADFDIGVWAFGNNLRQSGLLPAFSSRLRVPMVDDWCPNPLNFTIIADSQPRNFVVTQEDYSRHDLSFVPPRSGDQCYDDIILVTRLLGKLINPNELFIETTEILRVLQHPKDLPIFLQLDELPLDDLIHVDKPSSNICLRKVAAALSKGDPQLINS